MSVALEEVCEIVCVQLGVERVQPADRLLEDLGSTSADVLNLIVAIEDRFKISIDEEEAAGVFTVSDLHQLALRLS